MRRWLPLSCLLLGSLPVPREEPDRPNVLILSIDDLNDWVGFLGGHPQAATPHMDRLAERGTVFTSAHAQAPVCTPSRVSFFTGRLPSTTGVYFLMPPPPRISSLQGVATLPGRFTAAGYRTLGAGKFLFGGGERQYFDEFGRVKANREGGADPAASTKSGLWSWGPSRGDEDDAVRDVGIAEWAAEQLAKPQPEPFLLCVGFSLPHVPMVVPRPWLARFPASEVQLPGVQANDLSDVSEYARVLTSSDVTPSMEWMLEEERWQSCVQAYLAATAFVDACVGRVLDALAASEHADDTIVVLFSDHGMHFGEKQRFGKRSLWEESTRVPLLVSRPGGGANVVEAPVGLVDLFPTLLELTGLEPETGLDGVSLVPLLDDPAADWERPAVTTWGPGNHAVRSRRWRYVRYRDGSEELYDHARDPNEWSNLAGDPEREAVLQEHRRWLPAQDAELAVQAPCSGLAAYQRANALLDEGGDR